MGHCASDVVHNETAQAAKQSHNSRLRRQPILFDVFSGTGAVSSVFADEYDWKCYAIDNDPKQARRSKGVCADVTTYDFSHWPKTCDLLFLAPPCTPWSNATPLAKRRSPAYLKMGKLCEFAIKLIKRFKPRGFIFENPRYTKLFEQPYMQGIKYVHCDYCMYGLPYRKSTTLWHSDSISLKLKTCTCKGAHKVKLGGNYNGYKRWSKKHLKRRISEALARSIAEQVMT